MPRTLDQPGTLVGQFEGLVTLSFLAARSCNPAHKNARFLAERAVHDLSANAHILEDPANSTSIYYVPKFQLVTPIPEEAPHKIEPYSLPCC